MHTPGPWYPVNYGNYWSIQKTNNYSLSDDLLNEDNCKQAPSNAQLAASAPELLAALIILVSGLKKDVDMYSTEEKISIAEEAIIKATKRQS